MSALPRTEDVRVRVEAASPPEGAPGPLFLGVVVGPGSVHVAVTDGRASVLASARRPAGVADGPEAVVDAVVGAVGRAREDGLVDGLSGAGVGLPGGARGAAGWSGYPLGLVLGQRLGCPVRVDDDTRVMALGEVADAVRDVLYVDLGEGVRCGLVLDGRVHRGTDGTAGCIGHVQVSPVGTADAAEDDGPPCACGRPGCLDAWVGAPALARGARELAAAGGSPLLAGRLARTGRLGPADLAVAAAGGDEAAAGLVRGTGRLLGEHLAGLVSAAGPAVVVLGGEVAAALGAPLLEEVRRAVARRCPPLATAHLSVVLARPGTRAGVVGAARLARDGAPVPA